MSLTTDAPAPIVAPASAPVGPTCRFELVKFFAQWRIRLLILACWLLPAAFVAAVGSQGPLPTDTVFGRWMTQTGWAGPLVMPDLAGVYALPLLTSLVAGDVSSAEDRLGTWRHLLVVVRSPRRIFAAKALAVLTVVLLMVADLCVSSVAGGQVAIGDEPLVGLDGHLFAVGDTAANVRLAWTAALAPTLSLAALELLGSIIFGRSPMGLLLPALASVVSPA